MGLKCDHRYPYMREVDGDLAEGYTAMKAERFEDAVLRLALKVKERALSQGVQPRKEAGSAPFPEPSEEALSCQCRVWIH